MTRSPAVRPDFGPSVLASTPTSDPAPDRSAPGALGEVAAQVRALAERGSALGPVLDTWRQLAAAGRADLAVARLFEGHVDGVRILHEAGRHAQPGAVYAVWASASGGTGLTARPDGNGFRVGGTMRYCSGAWFVDRALIVVDDEGRRRLADVDVRSAQAPGGAMIRHEATWPALGMDATRSVDLSIDDLRIEAADLVGPPGFYLDRPGFATGGVGVAAVWLGGAAGVLDSLVRALSQLPADRVNAHQKAHLGVMATCLATADALLGDLATALGTAASPGLDAADAGTARSAVEIAVETVLDRAPRVSGPTPLCRDATFAHRMADLAVYVRQHHAESDHERLGAHLLGTGSLLGRRFG